MARTLPVVPNALKLQLHYTNGSYTWSNGIHFVYTAGPYGGSQLSGLASTIAAAWNTDMAPQVDPVTALTSVVVTDLSSKSGGVGVWTGSNPGTHAGTPLPDSACVLYNWPLSRRYRGGKPRTYFPGGVQAVMNADGRTWTAAFVTAFNQGVSNLLSAIETNPNAVTGLQPCNISYYEGFTVVTHPVSGRASNLPTLRTTPLVDISGVGSAQALIGSQRRRLRSR
jgi:hypothetical protein